MLNASFEILLGIRRNLEGRIFKEKVMTLIYIGKENICYIVGVCSVYRKMLEDVCDFGEEYCKKLSRPIKDLEDVRQAMAALETIRQNQIEMDFSLSPVEVRLFLKYCPCMMKLCYACTCIPLCMQVTSRNNFDVSPLKHDWNSVK